MVINAVGAVIGAGFGVQLGHMIDIFFGQTAGVVNRRDCSVQGVAGVLLAAGFVASLRGLALGIGAGVAFHGWVLWVELTGGISDENGWKVYAVGVQQRIKRLMVELLPDRVTIRRENQCVAHRIEVNGPILRIRMLWVAETAEVFGVAAVRLPILGLNRE